MFKLAYDAGVDAALTKLGYGGNDLRMLAMRAAASKRLPIPAPSVPLPGPGISRGLTPGGALMQKQRLSQLGALENKLGPRPNVPPPVPTAQMVR